MASTCEQRTGIWTLPFEVLEVIIMFLVPEPANQYTQNRIIPTTDNIEFFAGWRQRCCNLRLVCKRFADLIRLKRILFDTFYWHSTPKSLDRLQAISRHPVTASLLQNIVFFPSIYGISGSMAFLSEDVCDWPKVQEKLVRPSAQKTIEVAEIDPHGQERRYRFKNTRIAYISDEVEKLRKEYNDLVQSIGFRHRLIRCLDSLPSLKCLAFARNEDGSDKWKSRRLASRCSVDISCVNQETMIKQKSPDILKEVPAFALCKVAGEDFFTSQFLEKVLRALKATESRPKEIYIGQSLLLGRQNVRFTKMLFYRLNADSLRTLYLGDYAACKHILFQSVPRAYSRFDHSISPILETLANLEELYVIGGNLDLWGDKRQDFPVQVLLECSLPVLHTLWIENLDIDARGLHAAFYPGPRKVTGCPSLKSVFLKDIAIEEASEVSGFTGRYSYTLFKELRLRGICSFHLDGLHWKYSRVYGGYGYPGMTLMNGKEAPDITKNLEEFVEGVIDWQWCTGLPKYFNFHGRL